MNEIICADCLEVLKSMPDKSVDLVLTDPPYGIGYQSNVRFQQYEKIANDDAPCVEWTAEAYRVLADGGSCVCFYRWDVQASFLSAMQSVGFNVKSQIVWNKGGGGIGDLNSSFAAEHELALFATKGQFVFKHGRPMSVVSVGKVSPSSMVHPTEKPVALMDYLIRHLSSEGDTILDPFAGSGTTCVAAKILGRKYIGIEISPVYAEIARKRVEQAQYEERLFQEAA